MARLPSLFGIQVLEAAARLHSYSAAARELAVTQGAISQQIRKLEADFGTRLFFRSGNEMIPSAEALRLAVEIRGAVGRLQNAVDAFTEVAEQDPLVISMDSRFQGRWLGPRLARLLADPIGAHLDLRIEDRVANFVSDGVDLGIRVGRGNWSGLQSQRLTTERLCVVCTPEFAGRHRVNSVRDLAAVPLVHDLDRLWPLLFEPHGLMSPPPGNLVSNSTLLTVDAILRGLGAAILRYSMVEDDLRTGRLIRPVPDVLPLPLNFIKPGKLVSAVKPDAPTPPDLGYFAVWRAENRKRRRIEAIVNWLEQEAASSEEWLGQQIKDSGRRSHRVRRGKSARDSTVVRA